MDVYFKESNKITQLSKVHKKPVNKSIKRKYNSYKKKSKSRKKHKDKIMATVITCTNRPSNIKNVFENYKRQQFEEKELIIILNNNSMDIGLWKSYAKNYDNVSIFQVDESVTLGSCLNFAVDKSKGTHIAKFDDDDYYGNKYLLEILKSFKQTKAEVIGKAANYVYFEKEKILALRRAGKENCYVNHIDGPTLVIKREVFDKVKFSNVSRGEDKQFCKECLKKGIKIYSTSKRYHVYIRHPSSGQHTWSISNKSLISKYKILKRNITNYSKYVN